MAFQQKQSSIPASLGGIRIAIVDQDGTPANMSVHFQVQIFDQNGNDMDPIFGDLVPHLTIQQRDAAIQLMQDIRAKAELEIL